MRDFPRVLKVKSLRQIGACVSLQCMLLGFFSGGFLAPLTAQDVDSQKISDTRLIIPYAQGIDSSQWLISNETVFTADGQPANSYIADLITELEKPNNYGLSFSRFEFQVLLSCLFDRRVYTRQLIKYATPHSKKIQDNSHNEFSKRLMTEEKLQAGIQFLRLQEPLLLQSYQAYQVHPKDVVGILMWESNLGTYTGHYRIFNIFMGLILFLDQAEELAIAQLAAQGDSILFNLPDQQARFHRIRRSAVRNLASLLRITKANGSDPLEQFGSWGGAIGYVQFIPASLYFAVDGDTDGRIDLYTWPDAIHSLANYLKRSGYRETAPARQRAIFAYNHLDSYVNGVTQYADSLWNRYVTIDSLDRAPNYIMK